MLEKYFHTLKTNPTKAFFMLALFSLIAFLYVFRAQSQLNNAGMENQMWQAHYLKAAIGMLCLLSSLATVLYFVLGRFGKSGVPILNIVHFGMLLFLTLVILIDFFRPKPNLQELHALLVGQKTDWLEPVQNLVFLGSFGVLFLNVVLSFFKKSEV